jgi:hypothetical protein
MAGIKVHLESRLVWWRERVPFEHKAAIAVLAIGGLLIGGWLSADSLSTASAGTGQTTDAIGVARTPDRVVTVRDRGKPVTTRVYVTRKEPASSSTVVQTETAYGTSTVTVPAYVTHVVTAPALTVTDTQVVTTTRVTTTVQWRVITVIEKSPPVTVTVTAPGQ